MNLIQSQPSFSRSAIALLAGLSLCSFLLPSGTQVIPVTWSAGRIEKAQTASLSIPIHAWNCVCVETAAQSVTTILPNDLSGDTQRTRELLLMLEGCFEEAFLGAGGQIGTWRDNGTIAGIELRWSAGGNPLAPPGAADHLGTIGLVETTAGDPLAEIYCFDSTMLANRAAVLEGITGSPLVQEKVWLGPTFLSTNTNEATSKLSGTENSIYGDLVANGGIKVTGDDHNVEDQVRYGLSIGVSGTGHSIPDQAAGASNNSLPNYPDTIASYQSQAIANGTSFTGDITIEPDGAGGLQTDNGTPISGVVYSSGRIFLEGNGLTGTVTLVSALGISISGDQAELTAAVDDVLAIVLGGVTQEHRIDNNIQLHGRLSSYTGSLWTPEGLTEILLTGSELTGRVVADTIRCASYETVLTDGCR